MSHSHLRRRLEVLVAAVALVAVSATGCQSSPEHEETEQPIAGDTGDEAPPEGHPDHQADETDQDDGAESRHQHVEERAGGGGPDDGQLEELADQISDEDLEMFARGVEAVTERERELKEEGRDLETLEQEAQSPVEIREAEEEIRAEMQDALAEVGLRFPDFLQMGQVVRSSPELIERLEEDHLDEGVVEEFFGE